MKKNVNRIIVAVLSVTVIALLIKFVIIDLLSANRGLINGVPKDALLTVEQQNIVFQLSSLFENAVPTLQYNFAKKLDDGRGITFTYFGLTTETGDGKDFAFRYYIPRLDYALSNLGNSGQQLRSLRTKMQEFADKMSDRFLKVENSTIALSELKQIINREDYLAGFENFVKNEVTAESLIWNTAVDAYCYDKYFGPAMKLADQYGLTSAASRGQMYDAYINHGTGILELGGKGILGIVANTTKQLQDKGRPVKVETIEQEKEWLEVFLNVRYHILSNNPFWKTSIDRVRAYQSFPRPIITRDGSTKDDNMQFYFEQNVNVYGNNFSIQAVNGVQTVVKGNLT